MEELIRNEKEQLWARERDVRDDWNLIQNYFKEVDHQADQMQTVSL